MDSVTNPLWKRFKAPKPPDTFGIRRVRTQTQLGHGLLKEAGMVTAKLPEAVLAR